MVILLCQQNAVIGLKQRTQILPEIGPISRGLPFEQKSVLFEIMRKSYVNKIEDTKE